MIKLLEELMFMGTSVAFSAIFWVLAYREYSKMEKMHKIWKRNLLISIVFCLWMLIVNQSTSNPYALGIKFRIQAVFFLWGLIVFFYLKRRVGNISKTNEDTLGDTKSKEK